jgi:two-component system chemotaxis sensor kinase CheA
MFDASAFIEKFKEEALERLQRLNELYITLETDGFSEEILAEMLREAHTLKGSSRMVGISDISNLAHKLEEILLNIKEEKLEVKEKVSDAVFSILDAMLDLTEKGENDELIAETAIKKASAILNLDSYKICDTESVTVDEKLQKESNLKDTGLNGLENDKLKVHEMSTIRVRAEQVDKLLNVVGEAVIYSNRLLSDVQRIKETYRDLKVLDELWRTLSNALKNAEKDEYLREQLRSFEAILKRVFQKSGITNEINEVVSKANLYLSELHERIMELRMLPASYIFSLFPRAVRDMAKEFSKEIDLVIEGEETLIDKRVLEEIYDPLIHILRNAIDHGIEMPEERVAFGKSAKGTIKISALQEGDRIIIKVSDDGRGIDPDLIKKVAVKKGIITEQEAQNMSDEEAIYLIFKPGFSSKAETTQTSGRGIGMDVVKLHIEENLKGHIEIETEKGRGTTFILILPLTLAVIRSMIVRIGGKSFAFPTSNVQETILIKEENVVVSGGERFIRLRGNNIPLVRLSDVLQMDGIYEGRTALVINMSGKTVAYEVEEIVDEQPIVIKPLSSLVSMAKIYAGATILGSGEVVLIINVGELVRNTSKNSLRTQRSATKKYSRRTRKPRILVVEDSLTTRELEVNLLRAAGFDAEGVRDGLEALEALNVKEYDLVLTDVQMPRMNGIELIRRVKSNDRLKDIPMVVVSSLGSDSDIAAGLDSGADAYITKRDFDKDTLLGIIRNLIPMN